MNKFENLEQKRAINAFQACEEKGSFGGVDQGEVVKKLPPMIRENGMLGALAFALSKRDKSDGHDKAFEAVRIHLKSIGKINADNIDGLQKELMECSALKLRDVTAETMLYPDYLRRFAKKKTEKK
ncbi:MAG: type III-B CRISPR module-associated protein Cmr5 [Lentisphaeria bacterium]|nr:type III-B CRISPR module-associated protein Cmr5 [Lentisphaeria bacterium]